MGTVVLHAGMPKAGSGSVRTWLSTNVEALTQSGVGLFVVCPGDGRNDRLELAEYRSGSLTTNALGEAWRAEAGKRQTLLESFFDQLDAAAASDRLITVSEETMTAFISTGETQFMNALEGLGRRHEVRVAYYVRPQNTALEAGWRQWGFRTGLSPSEYVAGYAVVLDYFDTYRSTLRRAPSVSFEPRPFRRDLLDLGDPAADFVRRFLGLEDLVTETTSTWSNRGLPLEVVNALRCAPPGLLWSSEHDNRTLDAVKRVLAGLEVAETAETGKARLLLQSYSHERFEHDNLRLIEAMGWNTDTFVPRPDGDSFGAEPSLDAIDELWSPRGSAAELGALFLALEHAISDGAPTTPKPDPWDHAVTQDRHALAAISRDLATARDDLSRLQASPALRWYRRLAALHRRSRAAVDPTVKISKRLVRAAERVDQLAATAPAGDPPGEAMGRTDEAGS